MHPKTSKPQRPKNAINCDFPGRRAFEASSLVGKIIEFVSVHLMVHAPANFVTPRQTYGLFGRPAGQNVRN